MYLCYVDETGMDQDSPVVVTVGIVVEGTSRLVKTNREWLQLLGELIDDVGGHVPEIKSSQLYKGGGKWRRLGDARHQRIESLIDWFVSRSHRIALSVVDKDQANAICALEHISSAELGCALHIALQLQRAHQPKGKNKGVTLLVMDESKVQGKLVDALENPPTWTDSYYGRGRRDEPFNQLVHTPFYVKSDRIELVQLADLIAFIYRRFVEVKRVGEDYPGEEARITRWKDKLDGQLLDRAHRWPKRPKSPGAKAYVDSAPQELL